MTPNEDPGMLTWLLDHAWAPLSGLVLGAWAVIRGQVKGSSDAATAALDAHKGEDERRFKSLEFEQSTQRSHIGKIFDQLRDDSRRAEERHRELMQRSHDGHTELLMALNRKADK